MSELSYLEKLLDGAEVEWLPLSSLCNLITTGKLNANAMEDNGAYPFFTCNEEPYRINTYAFDLEAILISGNGSQVGHLNYYNGKFNAYQRTYILGGFNENVDIMYLYYYLMHTLKPYIHKNSRKGSVPYITMPMLENFKFPIPCPNNLEKSLAIQSEIVRILDKFTELTAELTAELTLRKKQYNYYRDKLLSFEECEVEWKTLDEVASFRRGSFPQPYGNSEWYNGEGCMPFVQVADVADFGFRLHRSTKQQISKLAQSKSVFVEAGTVIVSLQGTIGRVALTQYDCYVDRTLAIFTKYKAAVNKKYFAHQLKAKFDLEKEFARGSTLKTITKEEFSKFQIPIPPLEVQNRIVALLDKFDRLTHSIEEGLPRELELRQKQYEYYRELLFSFPKLEAASN
ncbi:TPA: restriction endonuclease subunit S [Escherichia coli]|nr:restriction endonuclease subunit S [Escherichia coli]ELH6240009.1 restriction endonuclease subunit S [Escherichia coli]HCO5566948.1 restriction endonuclease subunit S [Escherichia coli]